MNIHMKFNIIMIQCILILFHLVTIFYYVTCNIPYSNQLSMKPSNRNINSLYKQTNQNIESISMMNQPNRPYIKTYDPDHNDPNYLPPPPPPPPTPPQHQQQQ
ncbi:unnamed protein product [Schistosoma intercalatum]|nr:unnamed protein product [Schistosoma intercalatum]